MIYIEVDWALKQLEACGYISFTPDRQQFHLTPAGTLKANEFLETFKRVEDRILLIMHCGDITKDSRVG